VKFTNRFKYLGTYYLAQDLSDDDTDDVIERITS
jgi:hypothetical protein